MYVYFNKLVYTQFMPKNICKCHVANKEKSFHFVNNKKMDWNVISSAINDVFSIIRDPSLIDINMLLPGFDLFALIRDPSLICYCSMLM